MKNFYSPDFHLDIHNACLFTLVGDVVAMLQHMSAWTGHPATTELVLWLVGMGVLASSFGIALFFVARTIGVAFRPRKWQQATLVSIAMVTILAFYPEQLIHTNVGELLTVVVGAVLLFVPMRVLGEALVPAPRERHQKTQVRSRLVQWVMVIYAFPGSRSP